MRKQMIDHVSHKRKIFMTKRRSYLKEKRDELQQLRDRCFLRQRVVMRLIVHMALQKELSIINRHMVRKKQALILAFMKEKAAV